MTVVGQRKMAHWDDVDPTDTLRIHDKRLEEPPHYDSFGAFQYLLHSADVHMPRIDRVEPLINQANAFLDTVLDQKPCRSGGKEAEAVVAVLEAASRSLRSGGVLCSVTANSLDPSLGTPVSKPQSVVGTQGAERAEREIQRAKRGAAHA